MNFRFDQEKALAAVLYVARGLGRRSATLHRIFKVLYFADQKHLVRFGRPIIGDNYIAMRDGPVPSKIYDMVKTVRGDSIFKDCKDFSPFFDIKNGHFVIPRLQPDLDEFSPSDLQCLEESLKENRSLSYQSLKDKSHDDAYLKASEDDQIDYEQIAKAGHAHKSIIQYIRVKSDNERVLRVK